MIGDQELFIICNLGGIGLFVLIVVFHYIQGLDLRYYLFRLAQPL